jgi:hypothetical protein
MKEHEMKLLFYNSLLAGASLTVVMNNGKYELRFIGKVSSPVFKSLQDNGRGGWI